MSGPTWWAFGLAIDADGIDLPGLLTCDRPATVTVRVSDDPAPDLPSDAYLAPEYEGDTPNHWIAHVPGREYRYTSARDGVFVVSADGRQITCHPHGPAWAELLPMQVLPLAATLQGIEVFHASAVVVDGATAMLSAPSGTGKTTLAAHLVALGAELLADDVVAVVTGAEVPQAMAGSFRLRLQPPEADALRASAPRRFDAAGESEGKVVVDVGGGPRSAPLTHVCLLERAGGGPAVEAIRAVAPTALLGATFNLSVREPARRLRQLDVCEALSRRVEILRVRVTPDMGPAALAARLLDELRARA